MSSKLFVGNLSYSTGEAELRRAFEPIGALRSVAIITDRMTGKPRGFGFVEFERPDDAQSAISSLDGQQVDGRTISVSVARERERTPRFSNDGPGNSGGGYRGGGSGARDSSSASSGQPGGRSAYGSQPSYGNQPSHGSQSNNYGSQPSYDSATPAYGEGGYSGDSGGGGLGGDEGEGGGQRPRRGGGKGSRGSNRW